MSAKVVAVVCSDLHLSHKAPVARSDEPDWYNAMARPLRQMSSVCNKYSVPLYIAGDIFDRWNAPPELINFAIHKFSDFHSGVYSIPGQHDLPNHSMDEIDRSAYGTLALIQSVHDVSGAAGDLQHGHHNRDWYLYGYEWNRDVDVMEQRTDKRKFAPRVALIHSYIWTKGTGYVGVDDASGIVGWKDRLRGYDVAIFGDNHKGFDASYADTDTRIVNCGTVMRRKADEIEYQPHYGIMSIDDEGEITVEMNPFDTSKDVISDSHVVKKAEAVSRDASAFLGELQAMGQDSLDFREAVSRYVTVNDVDKEVVELILGSIEDGC